MVLLEEAAAAVVQVDLVSQTGESDCDRVEWWQRGQEAVGVLEEL
jgi:hypothetical protein